MMFRPGPLRSGLIFPAHCGGRDLAGNPPADPVAPGKELPGPALDAQVVLPGGEQAHPRTPVGADQILHAARTRLESNHADLPLSNDACLYGSKPCAHIARMGERRGGLGSESRDQDAPAARAAQRSAIEGTTTGQAPCPTTRPSWNTSQLRRP